MDFKEFLKPHMADFHGHTGWLPDSKIFTGGPRGFEIFCDSDKNLCFYYSDYPGADKPQWYGHGGVPKEDPRCKPVVVLRSVPSGIPSLVPPHKLDPHATNELVNEQLKNLEKSGDSHVTQRRRDAYRRLQQVAQQSLTGARISNCVSQSGLGFAAELDSTSGPVSVDVVSNPAQGLGRLLHAFEPRPVPLLPELQSSVLISPALHSMVSNDGEFKTSWSASASLDNASDCSSSPSSSSSFPAAAAAKPVTEPISSTPVFPRAPLKLDDGKEHTETRKHKVCSFVLSRNRSHCGGIGQADEQRESQAF